MSALVDVAAPFKGSSSSLKVQMTHHLLFLCIASGPHQVSVVGGAGALLGDAHAEAGQAAVLVFWAQMERSGLAVGARRPVHVHLQHSGVFNTI